MKQLGFLVITSSPSLKKRLHKFQATRSSHITLFSQVMVFLPYSSWGDAMILSCSPPKTKKKQAHKITCHRLYNHAVCLLKRKQTKRL